VRGSRWGKSKILLNAPAPSSPNGDHGGTGNIQVSDINQSGKKIIRTLHWISEEAYFPKSLAELVKDVLQMSR
jgi:hypothetical protein